jgi:uncharacterized protein involved in cysteine biosynthesis
MGIKSAVKAIPPAFREAFICLGLAFRDSLRPGILLRSAGICVLASVLWTWVFIHYYEQIAIGSGALSFFIVYGGVILGFLPGLSGGGGGMAGMAGPLGMMVMYVAALALIMAVVAYAGAIVLSIRVTLRWVLMGKVRARCLRHYPALQQRETGDRNLLLGVRYILGPWVGFTLGTLACLLIPLVNGVLIILLLAYLNVRFLVPAAFGSLISSSEQLDAINGQRGAMLAFGLLILLLALVPVVNLLLPALLAGGACHLGYRGLDPTRHAAGAAPAGQVSLPPV